MEERAANYAISNIVTKGGFIVATIAVFYITKALPFNEIIISLLFGVTVALLINLMVVTRMPHKINPDGEDISSKELLRFGLPFAFSTTLFFTIPLIEKIIIRTQTSWETLAIYTAAAIFVTVMNLVKTTVNSIWVPFVYKNYQNEVVFLSQDQKQKKQEAIMQKEKEAADLKKKYFGPDGELFKKRESLMAPIQDEIYNSVKEVAELRGYQMVLDRASDGAGIIFASPKIDISNEVLQKLGY
jgi:hypothetical protein